MTTTPNTTIPNQDGYWEHSGTLRTSDELSPAECWALATTRPTARLGFFRDGLLDIFPVNYFVMADLAYFRTAADGIIATSHLAHAAFQIDHIDEEARTGWTILLNGPVTRVDDPTLLQTLWGKVMDEPLAPGQRDVFHQLAPTRIRGRRLGTTH